MKTRIAAGLVCLAAALGLGAGAANAADAPAEQSPALGGITLEMPAVDLQTPDAPASPLLPSSSDVLAFMAESLTLVGRDILQPAGTQRILLPSITGSLTKKGGDANKDKKADKAGTAKNGTAADKSDKSGLNVIGDQFDSFWKGIQDTLGAIPLIGKVVQTPIGALRNSDPWANDITRVLLTVGLFLAPLSPLAGAALGMVAGVVVAIGAFAVAALPVLAVGLFGGLAAAFFAFGAGLVSGGGIIALDLLGFLLAFGGGIALIGVGIAGVTTTLGFGAPIGGALIALGAILLLASPFILLGLAPGIGLIVGGFVGAVLLTIAGVVVMIVPAVIAGLISAAVAGGLTLVIAIPVFAVIALVAGVSLIPAAFIVWAIQGSTRPANEKKPGSNVKPADKDKKAAGKGKAPKPAPAPAPHAKPADHKKVADKKAAEKKANDKKAPETKANPADPWAASVQSDFALAA